MYHFSIKEKQLLESGGLLTDQIINAACSLLIVLKKQFPDFEGLQTTLNLLQQSSS